LYEGFNVLVMGVYGFNKVGNYVSPAGLWPGVEVGVVGCRVSSVCGVYVMWGWVVLAH
jgi:hypothetical protein